MRKDRSGKFMTLHSITYLVELHEISKDSYHKELEGNNCWLIQLWTCVLDALFVMLDYKYRCLHSRCYNVIFSHLDSFTAADAHINQTQRVKKKSYGSKQEKIKWEYIAADIDIER